MSIRKIREQAANEGKVTRLLGQWRIQQEKQETSHWDGNLHPSFVAGCPTAAAYQVLGFRFGSLAISLGLLRIFDTGTAIHRLLQGQLLHAGLLVPQTGGGVEVPISLKRLRLVGSADGLIVASVYGRLVVLEIKSINSNSWRSLSEPKPEHKIQGACYVMALQEVFPEIESVAFLYYAKDTAEIKEFLYVITDEDRRQVETRCKTILEFCDAYQSRKTVPAPYYTDPSKPPCRSCAWQRVCHGTFEREKFLQEIANASSQVQNSRKADPKGTPPVKRSNPLRDRLR
jgi:CRISPR/Cas system-associated exonuclease Cas4 (RecB family)